MKNSFISILFLLVSSISSACSCEWSGTFLDLVNRTDVVAKIKVIDYEYEGNAEIPTILVAEVISIYKGKIESKIIRLYGDDGIQCRAYVESLKKDKLYFIQYHYKGWYGEPEINACGEYFVEIKNDKIIPNTENSFFEELYSINKSVNNFEKDITVALGECANVSTKPMDNIVEKPVKEICIPKNRNYLYYIFGAVVLLIIGFYFYKKKK